ncbi:hypothetical protein X777_00951 [Ooceraea biroi]|uniref:Uncharacterized protein n=1 Tax=Ooceraea biroi TaxID=2015173 RepID=A0A026WRW9_OOCBI|nr:hypothetical protein X777_00951 [Ooceraea biroi]
MTTRAEFHDLQSVIDGPSSIFVRLLIYTDVKRNNDHVESTLSRNMNSCELHSCLFELFCTLMADFYLMGTTWYFSE